MKRPSRTTRPSTVCPSGWGLEGPHCCNSEVRPTHLGVTNSLVPGWKAEGLPFPEKMVRAFGLWSSTWC